jgi:hypothetical protein
MVLHWRKEGIFNFLSNERFLNVLLSSAITLSGIGIALLGIIFVLPERAGLKGEMAAKAKSFFFALLKRCTAYFLLSSFLAFSSISFLTSLSSNGSENVSVAVTACSALSTILFLSGLLHLLYVCLKIEEAGS